MKLVREELSDENSLLSLLSNKRTLGPSEISTGDVFLRLALPSQREELYRALGPGHHSSAAALTVEAA